MRQAVEQLVAELHRHHIRLVLKDGKLKARHPYGPGFCNAPEEVKPWLRLMKACREELRHYLQEQTGRGLLDFYSWTFPCTPEEEQRVQQAFESNENTPVPVPERNRETRLDRWPPLPELISRLEAAGFRLERDGDLLRVVPPAPVEELSAELLELWNQATARVKAIALHLRGKQHQEDIRQNCRAHLPEGPDPMDYRFDVERQKWGYAPGWWKGVLH